MLTQRNAIDSDGPDQWFSPLLGQRVLPSKYDPMGYHQADKTFFSDSCSGLGIGALRAELLNIWEQTLHFNSNRKLKSNVSHVLKCKTVVGGNHQNPFLQPFCRPKTLSYPPKWLTTQTSVLNLFVESSEIVHLCPLFFSSGTSWRKSSVITLKKLLQIHLKLQRSQPLLYSKFC